MTKSKRPRGVLTPPQVDEILQAAKEESFFDYVALETMVTLGLKRSFLVGQNDERSWRNPGLLIGNLTPNGVNIEMKDGSKSFKPIPSELRSKINRVIGTRTSGPIFPRTTGWVWYRMQHYAEKAHVDVPITPNSFFDFYRNYRFVLLKALRDPKSFESAGFVEEPRALVPARRPSAEGPRETLDWAYDTITASLADDLLNRLKNGSPKFFEKVVRDILVAMGYAQSKKDAQVVGKSGDEGIDVIIKRDALGLNTLLAQAKRWTGTVGSQEVAQFSGSLDRKHAEEGVLITTSKFSNDAYQFVKEAKKKIALIDGNSLAKHMIDYNVGAIEVKTISVKKINKEYFQS